MNCHEELLLSSQVGNISSLQSLLSSSSFSQKEIDMGFRCCIKHYKQQSEAFIKCIKLYMNKIEDINYQNDTEGNTTIMMYCFTEGQETPSELIISCLLQEIDVNLIDINNETCLFKLLKSPLLSEATQKEFLSSLLTKKVDLSYTNKEGETLLSIASKMNKPLVLEHIKGFIKGSKFCIEEYVELVADEKYTEALAKLKLFQEKENALVENTAFKFNTLMMNFLVQLKALQESKIIIKSNIFQQHNSTVTITGMNSNDFIYEYHYQMISLLKGVNCSNTIDPVLLLNKAVLLYQLKDEEKLNSFIKSIEQNEELMQINYVFFYLKVLSIDMLMERKQFIEAKAILNELSSLIYSKSAMNLGFENKTFCSKQSFFSCSDKKEIDCALSLYSAYLNSFKQDDNTVPNDALKLINEDSEGVFSLLSLCLQIKLLSQSAKPSFQSINIKLEKLLLKGNSDVNQVVYYNSNGIVNLKLGNYFFAAFNFSKAIALIKLKSPMQMIKRNHFYPKVAYNLSLAFFFTKQYEKCFNLLSFLSKHNERSFAVNPYFYYRLGLSQLEMTLNANQPSPDKNDCFSSYSKSFFLLNTPSGMNVPESILINLKKALHLTRKTHPIYFNCYFTLIFSLILSKAYSEAIFHLRIILSQSKDAPTKEIAQMYLIECYLTANQIAQAKKLSESIILTSSFTCSLYEHLNGRLLLDEEFKFSYYLIMIKLNVLLNSRDEIEKLLIYILNSIKLSISVSSTGSVSKCEYIPSYLINVFVYYYLLINRKDLALSILKTRKIQHIFLPKGCNE